MTQPTLFMHVGLPKTATTSLQHFFFDHRNVLDDAGIVYPDPNANANAPKHQFMMDGLLNGHSGGLRVAMKIHPHRSLLVSTEGMSNHFYDFSKESQAQFRQLTHAYRRKIFIMVRPPEHWSKSFYAQSVINPSIKLVNHYATSLLLNEFRSLPRIRQLMDQEQLIADMKSGLGAEEVVAAPLDGNWMEALHGFLETNALRDLQPGRQNETPLPWNVEMLRQVNAYTLPENRRIAWKAALQAASSGTHTAFVTAARDLGKDDWWLEAPILHGLRPDQNPDFAMSESELDAFRTFVSEHGVVRDDRLILQRSLLSS